MDLVHTNSLTKSSLSSVRVMMNVASVQLCQNQDPRPASQPVIEHATPVRYGDLELAVVATAIKKIIPCQTTCFINDPFL